MSPGGGNWRKSRRSMSNGNCAEVGRRTGAVLVRDTTDRSGPVLAFGPGEWRAFLTDVKAGVR